MLKYLCSKGFNKLKTTFSILKATFPNLKTTFSILGLNKNDFFYPIKIFKSDTSFFMSFIVMCDGGIS